MGELVGQHALTTGQHGSALGLGLGKRMLHRIQSGPVDQRAY